MKLLTSLILALGLLLMPAQGWLHMESLDFEALRESANLVAVVKVDRIEETGKTKHYKDHVKLREQVLHLMILSALKGEAACVSCRIYREPTGEELIADGIPEGQLRRFMLKLGVDEVLHFSPARISEGDILLVYLKRDGEHYQPVTGDFTSRSLLRVLPSDRANLYKQSER